MRFLRRRKRSAEPYRNPTARPAVICPTVLAREPHEFREQMERIAPFAERIQIDLTDGEFTPVRTVELARVWWPHSITADLHLMYQHPAEHLEAIIKLQPHLVIVHAEARSDFLAVSEALKTAGIKVGLALLPDTAVAAVAPVMDKVDHVLIFAGDLGHFGGKPEINNFVDKLDELHYHYPDVEIGWDGGVTDQNARRLVELGVDVLNVGGFIQKAERPEAAYAKLKKITGH